MISGSSDCHWNSVSLELTNKIDTDVTAEITISALLIPVIHIRCQPGDHIVLRGETKWQKINKQIQESVIIPNFISTFIFLISEELPLSKIIVSLCFKATFCRFLSAHMEELDPMNGWYFCPFQQRQVTEPYQIVLVQSLILSIIKTKQNKYTTTTTTKSTALTATFQAIILCLC